MIFCSLVGGSSVNRTVHPAVELRLAESREQLVLCAAQLQVPHAPRADEIKE